MEASHLLVIADPLARYLRHLERLPDDTSIRVSESAEHLADGAADCDAILLCTGRNEVLRELWPSLRKLRWIHSMSAGIENVLFPELVASDVVLTNGRGVYRKSLAEFVVAAMLYFAKDLSRMRRNQQASRWEPFDVEMLAGATLGIAGYGQIGRAVARLAKAFGMRVFGLARSSASDEFVDEMYPPASRAEMLRDCDYVVVSSALTPETRGMIGRDELALLKPGAVLINVGRGPVVEEGALVSALQEGRLKGAALDVFDTEPLPETHPFWSMDNVLLSPHTADHTATWLDEAMDLFVANFERYRDGNPLENIADKKVGY